MTGPEHYRTAEALLTGQESAPRGTPSDRSILAEAQVHATLALAAATAINDPDPNSTGQPGWAQSEWHSVLKGEAVS